MTGRGTAAGISFQAEVGGFAASLLISGRPMARMGGQLPDLPRRILFETPGAVDDLVIETSANGVIYIQAKRQLSLSTNADSEIASVASQFVRQFKAGKVINGAKVELEPSTDRLVLVVSDDAPATVKQHLKDGLERTSTGAATGLPSTIADALKVWSAHLTAAWSEHVGGVPTNAEIDTLNSLSRVVVLTETHQQLAHEFLRDVVAVPGDEGALELALINWAISSCATGTGGDIGSLRRAVAKDIRLAVPAEFRFDIERLQSYSAAGLSKLRRFRALQSPDGEVVLQRDVAAAVRSACQSGSFLLTGEPGAGKSAVLHTTAEDVLKTSPAILLTVENSATSLSVLRQEIGLEHDLVEVLEFFGETGPSFLFVDALDAARGGLAEPTYRKLIEAVSQLNGWTVVASVRSFDLRLGRELRAAFPGHPPEPRYSEAAFGGVRHVHIPVFSPEELTSVETQSPSIKTALEAGGGRLRALMRNPFNLSLLSDLLVGGVTGNSFATTTTRGQLLERYWLERVEEMGLKAEAALTRVVERMLADRSPDISEGDVDPSWAEIVDELVRRGVLARSIKRRIEFRHHVLFDYSIARLTLAPDRERSLARLQKKVGSGLLLAPAMGYWLDEQSRNDGSDDFWGLIVALVASSEIDPIVRAESARLAVEFTTEAEFIAPLAARILADPHSAATSAAGHIIGSFLANVSNGLAIPLRPWASFASKMRPVPGRLVFALRALVSALIERDVSQQFLTELGSAALEIADAILVDEATTARLSPVVIPLLARTYGANPAEARQRLEAVFEPTRFSKLGFVEAPALAREIRTIAHHDPQFMAEIYRHVFGASGFSREETTQLGSGWILPLSSTAGQDFELSKYSLAEAFPHLLEAAPAEASRALAFTIAGTADREHKLSDPAPVVTLSVLGQPCNFQDDLSHIWAWDIESDARDDYAKMGKAFVLWAKSAAPGDVLSGAKAMLGAGQSALIWRVVMMAGAARPIELGVPLWPAATHPSLLLSLDTQQSAIALIASVYPQLSIAERGAFETAVEKFDFSAFVSPEEAKSRILLKLFGAVGEAELVTPNAQRVLSEAISVGKGIPENAPPFTVRTSNRAVSPDEWIDAEGHDLGSGPDAAALAICASMDVAIKAASAQPETQNVDDLDKEIARLEAFLAIENANLAGDVSRKCFDMMARAIPIVARRTELSTVRRRELISALVQISHHPDPETTESTEEEFANSPAWGSPAPRVQASEALACLFAVPDVWPRISDAVERLAIRDPHPAVRCMIAQALARLYKTAPTDMWRLVGATAEIEANRSVLKFFFHTLAFLARLDPERTEELFLSIARRLDEQTRIDQGFSHLLIHFALVRNFEASKKVLYGWIEDFGASEQRLSSVLAQMRELFVLGGDNPSDDDDQIRLRAFHAARTLVAVIEPILAAATARGDALSSKEISAVRIVDQLADQLYFAAGATDTDGSVFESAAGRQRFLGESSELLRLVSGLGTPRTVHHVLGLIRTLIEVDPEACFDLVSGALLRTGGVARYEYEPMGAQLFVEIVGYYLADHRAVFEAEERRLKLVDCISVFVDAGWPEARRLFQSLPELLA